MANITKLSSIVSEGQISSKVNEIIDQSEEREDNVEKLSRMVGSNRRFMDSMDQSMKIIGNKIDDDRRLRQRYLNEEFKLLKKELKTTEGLRNSLFNLANTIGGIGFLSAINQFRQGNVGAGTQDLLFATGSIVSQYIPEIITGTAVIVSQLLGFGRRGPGGGPGAGTRTNFQPRSRGRAAGIFGLLSLLGLISGARANASTNIPADQVRADLTQEQLIRSQTVSEPDVARFRNQLDRFGFLIDRLQSDREKRNRDRQFRVIGSGSGDGTTSKKDNIIRSTNMFPVLKSDGRKLVIGMQNTISDRLGKNGNPNLVGDQDFDVVNSNLLQIRAQQEFQKNTLGDEDVGVGMFNIEDPYTAVKELFEAKGMDFDAENILFTKELQRELFLFMANQMLDNRFASDKRMNIETLVDDPNLSQKDIMNMLVSIADGFDIDVGDNIFKEGLIDALKIVDFSGDDPSAIKRIRLFEDFIDNIEGDTEFFSEFTNKIMGQGSDLTPREFIEKRLGVEKSFFGFGDSIFKPDPQPKNNTNLLSFNPDSKTSTETIKENLNANSPQNIFLNTDYVANNGVYVDILSNELEYNSPVFLSDTIG